jgi:hypothetical protein
MSERLTIILTHQAEPLVAAMESWWRREQPGPDLLIAYGGTREQYERLRVPAKVFVDDNRLRTRDHQRERQSFGGVFSAVNEWLRVRPHYRLLHLTEFDCLPLCGDLFARLEARLATERADVLGCRLERVDGTNHPHFLYHASDPDFAPFLRQLSFWTREAFSAVAEKEEDSPLYLEIALPTIAHHLGFRVRGLTDQSPWVQPLGDFSRQLDELRRAGAWMAHPVKDFWERLVGAQPALP